MFNFLAQAAPVLGKVQQAASGKEPMSAAMLADAIPPEQRKQLGEQLLPMVKNICPDIAEKVTGMLMKLSNSDILKMLGSPEELKSKVDWAVGVLKGKEAAAAEAGVPTVTPTPTSVGDPAGDAAAIEASIESQIVATAAP